MVFNISYFYVPSVPSRRTRLLLYRCYWLVICIMPFVIKSVHSDQILIFDANPKEENNRQDNITKVQSLPKKVHQLRTKYWRIGRGVGIDKSQACFGSRYARCLHRGETKMPIFDYINIIAAHLSNSIFCYTLYMDKQEHTIVKMILGV